MEKAEKKKIMENALIKKYFGFEEVYSALKKGRRIAPFNDRNYIYPNTLGIRIKDSNNSEMGMFDEICTNDFARYENKSIRPEFGQVDCLEVTSFATGKSSAILYYYANPQMNRTFCKCKDGTSHDESVNIIDSMEFYDYEDFIKSKRKKDSDKIEVTISELEKMIGKKIVIKGE